MFVNPLILLYLNDQCIFAKKLYIRYKFLSKRTFTEKFYYVFYGFSNIENNRYFIQIKKYKKKKIKIFSYFCN